MSKKMLFKRTAEVKEDKSEKLPSSDSIQVNHIGLFLAVCNKDLESVGIALREGANVNVHTDKMCMTVLHVACAQGDANMLEVLLKAGADPKVADKLGRTPLHMAASAGSESCVALLLGAGDTPNFDYHPNALSRKNHTAKKRFGAKNEPQKTIPLENFELNIPVLKIWGRTALHEAVKANSSGCARMLLEADAKVDAKDEFGVTPLLLAGEGIQLIERKAVEKYEELVAVLLDYGADPNAINNISGTTALHVAVSLYSIKATKILLNHGADPTVSSKSGGCRTAIHLATYKAASEILAVIMESEPNRSARKMMANKPDSSGNTPLHVAAYFGCHHCVTILMDAGADLGATSNQGISAIEAMLRFFPRPTQCLTRIFDSKIRPNAVTVDERNFAVHLDFRPLAPHMEEKQTEVIRSLLAADSATKKTQRLLLSHPLVEAFVVVKWRRLRLFFHFLVAVQLGFVFFLSTYVAIKHCVVARTPIILYTFMVSRRIFYFSASVLLLNVIGQCAALPKYYLKQFEIWMNFVTGILSIVVATESNDHGDHAMSPYTVKVNHVQNSSDLENRTNLGDDEVNPSKSWVLHVSSVTILLSWIELMLLIGRFPTWGSHALLFYAVLKNVLKVLLAFGCLIIGFSFSFFVQFHKTKEEAFGDPWKAFVKTMAMVMGEFDYLNLFEERKDGAPGDLPIMSRVIFLSFVVLASIVLVNLMVGLAVSDTQALRSEGEERRLLKQAEFVAHLELGVSAALAWRWLPNPVLKWLSNRRAIPIELTVWPGIADRSVAFRNGHILPRRLLEDLVTIALRRRGRQKERSQCCHPTYFGAANGGDVSFILREIKEILESISEGQRNATQPVSRERNWSDENIPGEIAVDFAMDENRVRFNRERWKDCGSSEEDEL